MMVLLIGMVVLIGCGDAGIDSNASEVNDGSGDKIAEPDTRPAPSTKTPGEGEDNEHEKTNEPNNTSSPEEYSNNESIEGIVETVGNMQFEMAHLISIDTEGIDIEVEEVFDLDADAPLTTVVIDEQTVFEIVQSDGMSEVNRWEGSFDDISINGSVNVLGEDLGGEFLARKVIIWEFIN